MRISGACRPPPFDCELIRWTCHARGPEPGQACQIRVHWGWVFPLKGLRNSPSCESSRHSRCLRQSNRRVARSEAGRCLGRRDGDVVWSHTVEWLLFDDFTHEIDDKLECVAVEVWQVGKQLLEFDVATLGHDLSKLHEIVVLIEGANRVLHFTHHPLTVVGYNVRIFDRRRKVIKVVLAYMDLKLAYFGIHCSYSEQPLLLHQIGLIAEVTC